MNILFDSTKFGKSTKSRPFGRGIEPPPQPAAFEPSPTDRRWWAEQYAAEYESVITGLNASQKSAGRLDSSSVLARADIRNTEKMVTADYRENAASASPEDNSLNVSAKQRNRYTVRNFQRIAQIAAS